MDRAAKKTLRYHRTMLVDSVDPVDIKDHAFQHKLISDEDLQEVMAERVRYKRAGLFLDILMKAKQPCAFDLYCEILERDHRFVVKQLRDTWKRFQEAGEKGGIKLTQAQQQSAPSDILLQTVSENLGAEWERLAIQLGFNNSNIYHMKCARPLDLQRCPFDMLVKWKQKEASQATVASLISHLQEVVDDELLETIFVEKNLTV